MANARMSRSQRRKALLEAAAAVFSRKGFANARISDIAVEAGVGKGTVYEYFDSKEELFLEVFRHLDVEFQRRLADRVAGADSACGRLQALFEAGAEFMEAQPELYAMTLDFWAAVREGELREDFSRTFLEALAGYRRLTEDILRRGQASGELGSHFDPASAALFIVATLDGLGFHHFLDRTLDLPESRRSFLDLLCTGLRGARS